MSVDQPMFHQSPDKGEAESNQNWFGIVALVTGVLGISPLALAFGVLGMRAARQDRANNRGMALAGVVLGSIGLVAGIALTVGLVLTALHVQNAAQSIGQQSSASATPSLISPADATRFVLVPDATSDRELLDAAAQFLSSRVEADVDVSSAHDAIIVDFGGMPAGEDIADMLTRPSSAQFRPVVASASPETSSSEWPAESAAAPSWAGDVDYFATGSLASQFDATDCTALEAADAPASESGAVACAEDGSAKYLLGSAVLTADDVSAVALEGSAATITFGENGTSVLADVSSRLSGLSSPHNQVALTADAGVEAAPSIASPITAGVIELSFTDEVAAQRLVGSLIYGTPFMTLSVATVEG